MVSFILWFLCLYNVTFYCDIITVVCVLGGEKGVLLRLILTNNVNGAVASVQSLYCLVKVFKVSQFMIIVNESLLSNYSLIDYLYNGYNGTFLLVWTPLGQVEVSCLKRCPYFKCSFVH